MATVHQIKKKHAAAQLLTRRSYSAYKNMAARAEMPLPFSLADLRGKISYAVEGGHPCCYCQIILTAKNFSVDHILPVNRADVPSRAWWWKQGWGFRNLQVICRACNTCKGDLTHEEFRALLDLLNTFPKEAKTSVIRRLKTKALWYRK